MFSRNWFMLTVAYAVVALLGASTTLRAADEKKGETLKLETAHFEKPIVTISGNLRALTVGLEAKLNGKGGGTGTLTLDPNQWHGQASTLMRISSVKVTLKEIKANESANKGRQLYEINAKGMDERLLVAVPVKGDGPCWLLIDGKDGIEDMIELQRKSVSPN